MDVHVAIISRMKTDHPDLIPHPIISLLFTDLILRGLTNTFVRLLPYFHDFDIIDKNFRLFFFFSLSYAQNFRISDMFKKKSERLAPKIGVSKYISFTSLK